MTAGRQDGIESPAASFAGGGGAHALELALADQLGFPLSALVSGDSDEAGFATRAILLDQRRQLLSQASLERVLRRAVTAADSRQTGPAVDAGWMSRFLEGARSATTDSEVEAWSGLLLSECTEAGSIGRRTLGFLAEMEGWEVDAFRDYCAFAFAFESGWRFMFDQDFARREMWAYGREIDLTSHWIHIGLLAQESGSIQAGAGQGLRIRYGDRIWALAKARQGTGETDAPSEPAGIAYRRFTPIGQQIAGAFRTKVFTGYARNLVATLNARFDVEWAAVESIENS